jgi:Tol biopolymer transport system component
MEADGDGARPLIAGAYGIGWSPDGSHLLVVMQDPTTGAEAVATVGALGDDPQVLGPGSHGAWSPDGEVVAVSDPFRAEAISLVRLADRADAGSIAGSLPAWSPDGAHVAFLRRAPVEQPCEAEFCPPVPCGLWLYDVATGDEEPVTPDEFGCEYSGPHWSPDGSAIAIGDRVVGLDGSELLAWQESRSLASEPWSPDGSMVAALVADELMNRRTIEVIAVATGERRTVVPEGEALVLQVGWSPDGEVLVYSAVVADASGNGRPLIHVVRTDGGQPTAIGPDDAQFPLWQPLPSD